MIARAASIRTTLSLLTLGLALSGCRSTRQRIADALRESAVNDPSAGTAVCGYPVQRLTNVQITELNHAGSNSTGSGSATVTGTPIALPGTSVNASCSASVQFNYGSGASLSTVGGRASGGSSSMRVFNIAVTSRSTPVAPTPTVATGPDGGLGMPTSPTGPIGPAPGTGPRSAPTPGTPTPIAMGGVVTGTIDPSDTALRNGGFADDYVINLTAGVTVTIDLRGGPQPGGSGAMDVYLLLLVGGAEVAQDDDGGGYPNSRITYTPTVTGPHVLRVTTYAPSTFGPYTMETRIGGSAPGTVTF